MNINPRAFCENCDNFLLEDEIDKGAETCPNCSTELSWPNGKADTQDGADRPKFGDYVRVEQLRYGADNEMYLHKVIGSDGNSNSYVDVPVHWTKEEKIHDECVPVVRCVCCGVDERKILKYRVEDVEFSNHDRSFV